MENPTCSTCPQWERDPVHRYSVAGVTYECVPTNGTCRGMNYCDLPQTATNPEWSRETGCEISNDEGGRTLVETHAMFFCAAHPAFAKGRN